VNGDAEGRGNANALMMRYALNETHKTSPKHMICAACR